VSTYDNLRCGLGDSLFNTTFLVVPLTTIKQTSLSPGAMIEGVQY
jgi:hypothetical protein